VPLTPDKKCLHCEVGEFVTRFLRDNPGYSHSEAALDLMKISSQFIQHCLDDGIELGKEFLVVDEREVSETKH
jgi:hypothetical protein